MDSSLSAHQQLYLNSWHFFIFAALAVVLLRLFWRGMTKKAILLALNLYFVCFFVTGAYSFVFVLGMLIVTYAVGEARCKWEDKLPDWIPIAISVGMWLLLFFIKDPQLVPRANIFHYFPVRVIGISYIVFRCMQYMLDAEVLENRRFLTLVNFVLFFPSLMAGPIERYENFQAWHDDESILDEPSALPALHRIANGVIKKFVIADNLMALSIYEWHPGQHWPAAMVWVGVLLQLALLYLDFSGYCDIMIGIARLMKFKLCENFDRPWLAENIQEFWNRWHISLSRFIRDYVFTPLNVAIMRSVPRNRQFALVTAAYFFTMMLIALWHETTWGFFAFGVVHGVALVMSQVLKVSFYPKLKESTRRFLLESMPCRFMRKAGTYALVSASMLFWYFGVVQSFRIFGMMFGIQ